MTLTKTNSATHPSSTYTWVVFKFDVNYVNLVFNDYKDNCWLVVVGTGGPVGETPGAAADGENPRLQHERLHRARWVRADTSCSWRDSILHLLLSSSSVLKCCWYKQLISNIDQESNRTLLLLQAQQRRSPRWDLRDVVDVHRLRGLQGDVSRIQSCKSFQLEIKDFVFLFFICSSSCGMTHKSW